MWIHVCNSTIMLTRRLMGTCFLHNLQWWWNNSVTICRCSCYWHLFLRIVQFIFIWHTCWTKPTIIFAAIIFSLTASQSHSCFLKTAQRPCILYHQPPPTKDFFVCIVAPNVKCDYANDLLARRGMRFVSMSGGWDVARRRSDALFLKTSAGGSRVALTRAATSWKW